MRIGTKIENIGCRIPTTSKTLDILLPLLLIIVFEAAETELYISERRQINLKWEEFLYSMHDFTKNESYPCLIFA